MPLSASSKARSASSHRDSSSATSPSRTRRDVSNPLAGCTVRSAEIALRACSASPALIASRARVARAPWSEVRSPAARALRCSSSSSRQPRAVSPATKAEPTLVRSTDRWPSPSPVAVIKESAMESHLVAPRVSDRFMASMARVSAVHDWASTLPDARAAVQASVSIRPAALWRPSWTL